MTRERLTMPCDPDATTGRRAPGSPVTDVGDAGTSAVLAVRGDALTAGRLIEAVTSGLADDPERPVLVTGIGEDEIAALTAEFDHIDADPLAGAARVGPAPLPSLGSLAVLCSGVSDLRTAAEAAFSASAFGLTALTVTDVDAAAVPGLVADRPVLAAVDCLIAVGRDSALASALAELLSAPVIAVPATDGAADYPRGIAVVAPDDGVGAAACAWRIARVAHREPIESPVP